MFFYLTVSGIVGLLFGSLSTVLIERWHSGKGGILLGRSECPKCHHILSVRELIPLFSYIFQSGKCRHCTSHISKIYPFSEGIMASIFTLISYASWQWGVPFLSMNHILLLSLGFVTGVYILYDLRYMEIPDQILVPAIYIYLGLLLGSAFFPNIANLLFDRLTYDTSWNFIRNHLYGAWILYSFLYLQILIPGGYYLAKKGAMKDLLMLIISYVTFPIMIAVEFWKKPTGEIQEDIPAWVGGGDLRIAIFIGLTLGSIHGIISFAFAYIIGSIIGIIVLLSRKGGTSHQVPFGPFLGIGWIIALVFYSEILEYIQVIYG